MRKYNLPIFIPHRGCPHDCVFCNQRKITGVDTEVTPKRVRELVEEFLSTTDSKNSTAEVAFFGGSFTGLDMKLQEEFLKTASEFRPFIDGIRLSTRPDYINREITALLQKYGVTTVELGVQSTDDRVLEMNNRGHTFEDVKRASEMIKNAGISLGHQMMMGMFGSDAEKDMKTVRDIIGLEPSCVRIYPVVTLEGTELERLYRSGKYKPYSVEEAAVLAKEAVRLFRKNRIEVIRIGLHSSEDLEGGSVVAGPYHPAFGEICESLIYRDVIEKKIINADAEHGELVFECPKSDVSKAVGHRRMNSIYFRDKYGIRLRVRAV